MTIREYIVSIAHRILVWELPQKGGGSEYASYHMRKGMDEKIEATM